MKQKLFPVILAVLVVSGIVFGVTKFIHSLHHEETDDAQVDANISPVIPRVSGYISEIRVKDNQHVSEGDTLLVLDDRDLRLRLDQAEAALESAKSTLGVAEATTSAAEANIVTSQANIYTIDAQIEAAKVSLWRATQDYNRYANLIRDHSITEQQYEQALAARQTAERQLKILEEQKSAAGKQTHAVASQTTATSKQVSVANAAIRQREADVETARLNLSYCTITAPSAGLVSRVNVQKGQLINAGQSMFSIVSDSAVWVVANFKETQLTKMKPGQKVVVTADAFPGHAFKAEVASFAPATGARFSLLPPDNASGNFVKVVQRLPVRIEFTDRGDQQIARLRPGMNLDVDVLID